MGINVKQVGGSNTTLGMHLSDKQRRALRIWEQQNHDEQNDMDGVCRRKGQLVAPVGNDLHFVRVTHKPNRVALEKAWHNRQFANTNTNT